MASLSGNTSRRTQWDAEEARSEKGAGLQPGNTSLPASHTHAHTHSPTGTTSSSKAGRSRTSRV